MKISDFWRQNKAFTLFLGLMFAFRSAIADWNHVPTGSMKPTIMEGDRIWVNKLAYDVKIPFTGVSLAMLGQPARGDIIVFNSEASGKRLVKRVVGVPGDKISLYNNTLFLNGKALEYRHAGDEQKHAGFIDLEENLNGVKHAVRIHKAGSTLSSFHPVTVPEEYYLVLGDNRDQSADSRVIGLVPRHEIIGRSSLVVMSFNYDNYYIPRKDRFFVTL